MIYILAANNVGKLIEDVENSWDWGPEFTNQ